MIVEFGSGKTVTKLHRSTKERLLIPGGVLILFMAGIEAVLLLYDAVSGRTLPAAQFPRPHLILERFITTFPDLQGSAWSTSSMAAIGFGGGLLIGAIISSLLWWSGWLNRAIGPYLAIVPMVPIIAVAPLVALMINSATVARIVLASYITFFPVVVSTLKGLKGLGQDRIDLARTYGMPKWQQLVKLNAPNALPYFFAGARVGATWSVVGAIVLEFTGTASEGLGVVMLKLSYFGALGDRAYNLWAAALMAATVGLGLYTTVVVAEALAMRGRTPARADRA